MNRRGATGLAILGLWAAGLAVLLTRQPRPGAERLAAAALRVAPGAAFYAVLQGERQIGFASSTIDTTPTGIEVSDYLVANVPVGKAERRATAHTRVYLTRGLRVDSFKVDVDLESGPVRAGGQVFGDSLLLLTVAAGSEPADTQRIALTGPVLLPTIVPLAVALTEDPDVGRVHTLPVFDPATMGARDVQLTIRAESLFVVSDSARFDSTGNRWTTALLDTVRAWEVVPTNGGGFTGWVDAQGRIVEGSQLGLFTIRRMAYELAFENWRLAGRDGPARLAADDDILETTAIAASAPLGAARRQELRVRLSNVALGGFALDGGRQQLSGDTLVVTREPERAMVARYRLPSGAPASVAAEIRPEPLIQSRHPQLRALARRIAGGETDPRIVAERLNAWVHDSLRKEITLGIPSALQVMRAGSGDCNEHTQLYLALARSLGLPARSAAGLAYVNGKFYYHAWPEVYLGNWVAVDPTFGQFPADAAHLRFVTGGLAHQAKLLRLIGNLDVEVLE